MPTFVRGVREGKPTLRRRPVPRCRDCDAHLVAAKKQFSGLDHLAALRRRSRLSPAALVEYPCLDKPRRPGENRSPLRLFGRRQTSAQTRLGRAGIRETGASAPLRVARGFHRAWLEAFVYAEAAFTVIDPDLLRFLPAHPGRRARLREEAHRARRRPRPDDWPTGSQPRAAGPPEDHADGFGFGRHHRESLVDRRIAERDRPTDSDPLALGRSGCGAISE
jgi:hypothetical protein